MNLFALTTPVWELVVRAAVIYFFLLVLLRITGKRQVGQLAPFDLVLLLILSNAVQNSMTAGDNSMVGGMVSAFTLVLLNAGLGYLAFRNKKLEVMLEGQPQVLVHNGVIFQQTLNQSCITMHDLHAALRRAGCLTVEEVHIAMLENNGGITVIKQHEPPAEAPPTAAPPSAS